VEQEAEKRRIAKAARARACNFMADCFS